MLLGYGLVSPSANMGIDACQDLGQKSLPTSSGRLLHPDGRFSAIDDARNILDLLVGDGWEPVQSDRFEEGIQDRGAEYLVVAVRRGELRALVRMRTDIPVVGFDVLGRCLPNTEEERDLYRAVGEWDLLGPEGAPELTPPATTEPG
jgi:hypothetical protein